MGLGNVGDNTNIGEIISFEKLGTNAFQNRQVKIEKTEKGNNESEDLINPE